MELRPYQKEIIDIIDNLNSGSYLVQLATGLGKTVTFANIKRKGRVLVLTEGGKSVIHLFVLERFVLLALAFVACILEILHECKTQRVYKGAEA